MKYLTLLFVATFAVASCTKSETQYKDQENKMQSVNNPQSDTIKTLNEHSDTIQGGSNLNHRHTDNE